MEGGVGNQTESEALRKPLSRKAPFKRRSMEDVEDGSGIFTQRAEKFPADNSTVKGRFQNSSYELLNLLSDSACARGELGTAHQ